MKLNLYIKTRGSSLIGHNNKNGIKKEDNIYGQNFLTFWKTYPKKAAKKTAYEKAWQKLEKTEDMKALLPIMLDAIEKQKQAKERGKADGEFVPEWPYPGTWLNGKRWEDEVGAEKQCDKSWDI